MEVDIEGMILDGLLSLSVVMHGKWDNKCLEAIGFYEGKGNRNIIVIQHASAYGISAYRWVALVDGQEVNRSLPFLTRSSCVRDAHKKFDLRDSNERR